MRRVLAIPLVLAAAAALLSACAAPSSPEPIASASASLPAGSPVVAFYGDSYTLGTGASDPSLRWSTRICAQRGWVEFNPSVNGLGFVNHRSGSQADLPGLIIDAEPDIVIITLGLNDNFSYSRAGDRIHEQIGADFDRLHDELPDARIVVVEPFWYSADRPASVAVINRWVREAAARIGADFIPGASVWIQGRPGEMAADGLHPNDAGYDLLTREMDAALTGLGL